MSSYCISVGCLLSRHNDWPAKTISQVHTNPYMYIHQHSKQVQLDVSSTFVSHGNYNIFYPLIREQALEELLHKMCDLVLISRSKRCSTLMRAILLKHLERKSLKMSKKAGWQKKQACKPWSYASSKLSVTSDQLRFKRA